jgi:hypothetical protein
MDAVQCTEYKLLQYDYSLLLYSQGEFEHHVVPELCSKPAAAGNVFIIN